MSYLFPFSVIEKDKEGYYIDRHVQNIDVEADNRSEAIQKVRDLAGKPSSGRYFKFYMGNIRSAPTHNKEEEKQTMNQTILTKEGE